MRRPGWRLVSGCGVTISSTCSRAVLRRAALGGAVDGARRPRARRPAAALSISRSQVGSGTSASPSRRLRPRRIEEEEDQRAEAEQHRTCASPSGLAMTASTGPGFAAGGRRRLREVDVETASVSPRVGVDAGERARPTSCSDATCGGRDATCRRRARRRGVDRARARRSCARSVLSTPNVVSPVLWLYFELPLAPARGRVGGAGVFAVVPDGGGCAAPPLLSSVSASVVCVERRALLAVGRPVDRRLVDVRGRRGRARCALPARASRRAAR